MIEDMMDGVELKRPNELRLLMLGRTGAGMTSTANNILHEKIFEERVDTRSKTQLCEFVQRTVDGRRVTIVDTPGFYNTERPENHTEWEIDRSVAMAPPGPHAFLLVVSMTNRFPPEAQETIRRMEAKFGNDVYKHLIVVFTGKDTLDGEKRTFADFRQNGIHHMVEDVLRKCNQRCVAFNNKAGKEENDIQLKTLLEIIDHMVEQNGGGFYSAERFASAAQKVRRKLASWATAVRARFHFNLINTFYVLVSIVVLFVVFSLILAVVLWSFRPESVASSDSELRRTDSLSDNATESILPSKIITDEAKEPEPEHPKLTPIKTYFYTHVLLGSLGRGVCLKLEDKRCLSHWFHPFNTQFEPIDTYFYTHVLLGSLGRGVCLKFEEKRCLPGWFHPMKPAPIPPIDLLRNVYATVMLNAVQRSWSLVTEMNQTGQGYYEIVVPQQAWSEVIVGGITGFGERLTNSFANLFGILLPFWR